MGPGCRRQRMFGHWPHWPGQTPKGGLFGGLAQQPKRDGTKKERSQNERGKQKGRARFETTSLDSNGLAPQPSHAASRACSIARVSRVPRLRSITRTLATRKAPELVPNMSAILSPRFPCPAMAACCSFCLDSFKYPAGLAAAQRWEGGRGPARVKGM